MNIYNPDLTVILKTNVGLLVNKSKVQIVQEALKLVF